MTTPAKPTNTLAVAKPSALNIMAARMNVEPAKLFETLRATVFQKATNEELMALTIVANTYSLDPFLKEIFAFPAKGGGIVPIVSVDGWNKLLIRQPDFDGIEFEFQDGEDGMPYSCTATIYVKNRSKPVKITEYFAECQRNTEPWKNMPRRMLRNRTLCQASRVAFGFSGIKHEDEALDIQVTVTPSELPPKKIAAGATPPADGEGDKSPTGKTPQQDLEAVVVAGGFTFTDLQKWGGATGNIEGAESLADFSEIPSDIAKRILRNQKGLLTGLEQAKTK